MRTSNTSSRTNRRARSGLCPTPWRARASFRWGRVVRSPPGCVVAAIPGHQNCGMGTPNEANFLRVKPYLDLFPLGPNQPGNVPAIGETAGYESASFGDPRDQGNGTAQILVNATSPGTGIFHGGACSTGPSRTSDTSLRATCSTTRIRRSRSTATFRRGRSWRTPATSTSPSARRRVLSDTARELAAVSATPRPFSTSAARASLRP